MKDLQAIAQVNRAKSRSAQARIHAGRLQTLANKPKPSIKK